MKEGRLTIVKLVRDLDGGEGSGEQKEGKESES